MNMHKLIPSALTVVLFVSLNLAQSSPDYNAYIPEDKGLDPAWVASLSSRGEQKVYQGQELDLIGMPCGGIGAGQLEISGKGTLGTWWIFNVSPPRNGGLGSANGARYLKPAPIEEIVENDFAIRIQPKNDNPKVLKLDGSDFDDMRFIGEYPIASFDYRRQANDLPVTIRSKVFSPFVPLSVRDSANPVTAFRFTVENTSHDTVNIQLGGWLENACVVRGEDQRLNQVFKGKHLRGVQLGLQSDAQYQTDENPVQKRADLDYDQFEGKAFSSQWTVEGQAFGTGPFNVSLAKFNKPLMNYQGKAVASSFHSERNEQLTGKLISWPFKIERSSIRFKIAGGNHENETCIHLLVDDKVVRAATGDDSNTFRSVTWDVTDLQGQMTRLEIVDQHKGSWGFVKVDDIVFFDKVSPYGDGKPEYGNLAISVMDDQASASAAWTSVVDFINALKENTKVIRNQRLFGAEQIGGGSVISEFTLAPNERKTVTFLISWYFPNLYNELAGGFAGHIYNNWYGNAADAAQWVADNYDRLYEQTELFRRTYHNARLQPGL